MTDDTAIAELARLIEHDTQYPQESASEIARRIHAAGWRRPGSITDAQVEAAAKAICKSRSCEGYRCCQWPAQKGRETCPVKCGGYDDAARAVLEAAAVPAAPNSKESQ